MELEFRPDFEEVRKRWRQFHCGKSPNPMIHAIVPSASRKIFSAPSTFECAFGDIDSIAERILAWAASHEFLGDAIPRYQINFTAGHLAPLLGADLRREPSSNNTP